MMEQLMCIKRGASLFDIAKAAILLNKNNEKKDPLLSSRMLLSVRRETKERITLTTTEEVAQSYLLNWKGNFFEVKLCRLSSIQKR
jgi:hypothetical protein